MPKSDSQQPHMASNSDASAGTHTLTHLGPLATQALNLLQNSPGSNVNPNQGGGLSTATISTRPSMSTSPLLSNSTAPLLIPTKQSTLDSHLASTVVLPTNFPLPPTQTSHK